MGKKRTKHSPPDNYSDDSSDYDMFFGSASVIEESNDNSIFILDSSDLRLLVIYSYDRVAFVVSFHAMSLASLI